MVRPPGHHAEPVRARGVFVYLIMSQWRRLHAQTVLGCERVLIVDWDAHHGNGTSGYFSGAPS